jgi:hypothetical protein
MRARPGEKELGKAPPPSASKRAHEVGTVGREGDGCDEGEPHRPIRTLVVPRVMGEGTSVRLVVASDVSLGSEVAAVA